MKEMTYLEKLTIRLSREKKVKQARKTGLVMLASALGLFGLVACAKYVDEHSPISSIESKANFVLKRPEMIIGQVGRVIYDDNPFSFPIETSFTKKIEDGKGTIKYTRYLTVETFNHIEAHNLLLTGDEDCNPVLELSIPETSVGTGHTSTFSVACNVSKAIVFDKEKTYLYRFRKATFKSVPVYQLDDDIKETMK